MQTQPPGNLGMQTAPDRVALHVSHQTGCSGCWHDNVISAITAMHGLSHAWSERGVTQLLDPQSNNQQALPSRQHVDYFL
jgi:hypothetical protein